MDFVLNHLGSVMAGSGGLVAAVMAMIEISPIKINPWSRIAKTIGNAMNAGVMDEIKQVKTAQEETRKKLDDHIEESEERKADNYKSRVLRFNNELVRGLGHTEEIITRFLISSGSTKIIVRHMKTTRIIKCHTRSRMLSECMMKCSKQTVS